MSNTIDHPMYNLDILSRISQFIPLHMLPDLDSWPDPAKETVVPERRRRIWEKLKPFIPKPSRPFFFSNLASSGGALVGDFALQIILEVGEFEKRYKGPRDLEIAVRYAREEPIISFFEDIGYRAEQLPTPELLQDTVEMVQLLEREVDEETYRIRVYTSKTHAIAVVLGSPYTAYWNAITATEIVVFCPQTTLSNQSLVCDGYRTGSDNDLTFDVLATNESWSSKCEHECPMKLRKTIDDKAVMIYHWSEGEDSGEGWAPPGWPWMSNAEKERYTRKHNFCLSEAIQWRVSRQCHNTRCMNSLLAEARRRVIPTV